MSEIQTTDFDETAANNNAASPNGFPEGMAPSGVNDSARELMAQIKRFFNRITGRADAGTLISSAGVAPTFTVTFDTAPASLYTGLIVGFKAGADFGADPTLNVNALGAVNIQKMTSAGYANLISGDIKSGQHVWVKYDGTLTKWILLTPGGSVFVDPMTTRGDTIIRNAANTTDRLAVGAANTVLKSDGTDPSYGKVTVSMLNTGTDGELITWDASGNPTTVAVGTSGHVLTSNGAGAAPTFQAAQAGWAVLSEQTAASSTSLDFDVSAHSTNYEDFEFIIVNLVPASSGVDLLIRTSTNAGSSYDSGATDYNWMVHGLDEDGLSLAEASASATSIQLNGTATISNVASDGVAGRVTCYNPANTSFAVKFTWSLTYGDGADWNMVDGGGNRQAAADVDHVRFLMSSGNISSGKIVMIGRRKAS